MTRILAILPWMLLVLLLGWMLIQKQWGNSGQDQTKIEINTLLTGVENLGKVELIKYNFQEITEVKKITGEIDLKLFKYKPVPDAKGVLISQGSAVGCVDLTQISREDIVVRNDTLLVKLPYPEICYFKIDLEKSRVYDLQIGYMRQEEQKQFIQELYRVAESEIEQSAIKSGIMEQTKEQVHSFLRPLLENLTDHPVVLYFDPTFDISPAR